ncbi:MAG: hypothetical protein KY468_07885, partial [Armatimonadetes bacterium]|nr:hypothetical protein [Armatimonadota bacterium]
MKLPVPGRRPSRLRAPVYRILFLSCCLALSAPPPASGQGLSFQVKAGLDGQIQAGRWMPVVVEVRNRGPHVTGDIRVTLPRSDSRFTVTTVEPLDVAEGARQRHTLYVKPEDFSSEMKVTVAAGRDRTQQSLKLGRLRPLHEGDALILLLDSRPAGLSFLSGMPLARSPKARAQGNPSGEARVAYLSRPEDLPDDRRGLNLVQILVWGDLSPDALPPERLQAVRDWVLSGGTLLLTGGADYRRLQSPALADLMPVTTAGVETLNGLPLPAFNARIHGTVAATVTRLKAGAEYVPGTQDRVVRMPLGLGRVLFTAFDPTADAGGGDPRALWKGLLKLASPARAVASPTNPYVSYGSYGPVVTGDLSDVAMQMPSVGAPSFAFLGGYLFLYLLLLSPVNYFVLRRMRRQELAWVTFPAIIALFTLGSYGAGYAMKGGDLKVNEITRIRAGVHAGRAPAVTHVGLFSPRRHAYRVDAEDPGAVLAPVDPSDWSGAPRPASGYT